jgi:hypothetical protein
MQECVSKQPTNEKKRAKGREREFYLQLALPRFEEWLPR